MSGAFSGANSVPSDAIPLDDPEGCFSGHSESVHSEERAAVEDTGAEQPWIPLVLASSAPFKLVRKTMKAFEKRVFVEERAESETTAETVITVNGPGESSERVNAEVIRRPYYRAGESVPVRRTYNTSHASWRSADHIYSSSKPIAVHPLPQR